MTKKIAELIFCNLFILVTKAKKPSAREGLLSDRLRTDFIELYSKLSFLSGCSVFVKDTLCNSLVDSLEC